MPPPARGDRYEPLPPVYRLPGWLWARMGTPARAATVAAALAALAATAILAPKLAQINSDNEEAERREIAADRIATRKRVREEQRPHRAMANGSGQVALLAALKSRIEADARARPGLSPVKRVACRTPDRAGGPRTRYACTAVTSVIVSTNGGRGVVGYPYRALVERQSGRLTWCKVAGSAGEGSFNPRNRTPIPRACGG